MADTDAYEHVPTRARNRIKAAVESRGHRLARLTWEPVSMGSEKCGAEGGWWMETVEPFLPHTSPGNFAGGLSVEDLLAEIDCWLTPPEPCACERPRFYSPTRPLRGEGHLRAMHDPSCRWFIAYRLPWWTDETPALNGPSKESDRA